MTGPFTSDVSGKNIKQMEPTTISKRFQKPGSFYLWAGTFFLLWILIIIAFYVATIKIDYIWHWEKIPGYFLYKDTVAITAEIEGEVETISIEGEKALIRVKGYDETDIGNGSARRRRQEGQIPAVLYGPKTEDYTAPAAGLIVEEGDLVSPGDTLATFKKWEPGVFMIGLAVTIEVSILSTIFGILIGIVGGLARVSSNPLFKWSSTLYVELIRGSPLLVQIFIWYFLLGTMINGIISPYGLGPIDPLWYGVASLSTFTGAYVAEIVRAGIQSIHSGQVEAARSLGMTYAQSMRYIILPQALRRILPPLAGQFISLVKDSSLLGIIAVRELTKATREIVTVSLQTFESWMVCAVLYLIVTFALSMFVQHLERRMQLT
jgi:polar amino acid transport system permease protein